MLMVPSVTLPEASRLKAETISASAWVPADGLPAATVELTDSQLEPEKVAASAKLFSWPCSAVISVWILSLSVGAGADGRDELDLDLVDRVDGLVHGGVGGVDLGGAEAERVLDVESALLSERIVVAIDQ